MQCLSSTTDTYLKTDLIAELKISKDISGIRKMKVEKAKLADKHDQDNYADIQKKFTSVKFIEQVRKILYLRNVYLFIIFFHRFQIEIWLEI